MDVTIGMHNVSHEVSIQTEATLEDLTAALETALTTAAGVLEIVDSTKGRTLLVPGRSIAYVELSDDNQPRVGFGASF